MCAGSIQYRGIETFVKECVGSIQLECIGMYKW